MRARAIVTSLAFFATEASADDVLRFDVTGVITPSCSLVTDRARIDLGSVAASDLPALGAASRWRPGGFFVADCVGATRASVTVRATADPIQPRYLATRGDARGVAIEMRTASGKPVLPDGTSAIAFDLAGPAPELGFEARYVRVGPLGAGEAPATALVQITWE
jgi:type 1 fimbria pilin